MDVRLVNWYNAVQGLDPEEAKFVALNLSNLNLTQIPDLPEQVQNLNCDNNRLTSLHNLPPNLYSLSCSGNFIESLDAFPESLQFLNCSRNRLSYLPTLPHHLKSLDCSSNQLRALPMLTESLAELDCSFNQLTSLPHLHHHLNTLTCSHNKLTHLPPLPENITTINCSHNDIKQLPMLPESLISLRALENPLEQTPNKPSRIVTYELPEIVEPSETDERNFENWNPEVDNTKFCFDDTLSQDRDVVEFLTYDSSYNNIIVSINGVLKCYQRNMLWMYVNQRDSQYGYINMAEYEGTQYARLITGEYITSDGLNLLMNKKYSIYNIVPADGFTITVRGEEFPAYNVDAFTVREFVQVEI